MVAVKDFIPLGDVKMTIEKEVKRKPSVEELTTIETPGKPVPATNFEKKRRPTPQKKQSITKK